MPQPIRLLVVDDSALMRKHMRQIFEAEGDFTLAFARNGREALDQARAFLPDVVTLDVNMPELDGISCLEELMQADAPARVVMVSSLTEEGAAVTLRALELGAVDFVPKPDGTVSLSIDRIRPMLLGKVRAAARARPRRVVGLHARVSARRREVESRGLTRPAGGLAVPGMVLIGVSTGGPRTLEDILPALPADFPYPVLVAQHMPSSFTGVFARRMDGVCALEVCEVDGPMPLAAGRIHIGRGDADIVLERRLGRVVVNSVPADDTLWHPSADRLVSTAMQVMPAAQITGVLLTGMGHDGAASMAELRQRGGRTIAESQESAVVFGMPAALIQRGGAELVLPAERVAAQLQSWARRGR
jgi:two-component system chemotaxis response regulator CheB